MPELIYGILAFGSVYFSIFAMAITPASNLPSLLTFRIIPFFYGLITGMIVFDHYFGYLFIPNGG